MSGATLALVDCNNFYVSCERLLDPRLDNKPVVVLSNNDGCVVARSQEVKDLGVKMGTPWFKLRDLARTHGIIALSSNYTLYADLSNRVMRVLAQFSPQIETYSIDEAFLDLGGVHNVNLIAHAQRIRATVQQWLGLPVCVGLGATKTLAKLANHVAKKRSAYRGVCDLNTLAPNEVDRLFASIAVSEVWGVGTRTTQQLAALEIRTVLDLKRAPQQRIREQFGVVLERTVAELNGVACLALELIAPNKQQIICSRSFGAPVLILAELEQAVIAYVSRAAHRLRRQQSLAGAMQVFIQTNAFKPELPQYAPALTLPLPDATDDTRHLVQAALAGVRRIYRPGYAYKKAGVMLSEIRARGARQATLFDDPAAQARADALMSALDRVNARMGQGTLRLLGEGFEPRWAMRRDSVTPRYSTHWAELARAG